MTQEKFKQEQQSWVLCDMSVSVSVIPVCATNQELNLTVLVSSLSVEMFHLNSILNFGILPVLVFQLEVY